MSLKGLHFSCVESGFYSIYYPNMDETTIETTETSLETEGGEEEKPLSDFAKFKNKIKSRYEGEISSLKERINELEGREYDNNKKYFSNTLKNLGYDWDFDGFFNQHDGMDIDDMVALYRGLNMSDNPKTSQKIEDDFDAPISKSVLWKNPTTNKNDAVIVSYEDFEKAPLDKKKEFLKSHPELFS